MLEGTQGLGVVLAESNSTAKSILQAFNGLQARVIIQEYISDANGSDIRALIIDGQVIGAIERTAVEGEFRSNLHRGGEAKYIKLNTDQFKLAINAAKVLKVPICGVDMLDSAKGPLLLEVNSTPGLEGIEKFSQKNIARAIITFIERNN